jgi:hypothetical protein
MLPVLLFPVLLLPVGSDVVEDDPNESPRPSTGAGAGGGGVAGVGGATLKLGELRAGENAAGPESCRSRRGGSRCSGDGGALAPPTEPGADPGGSWGSSRLSECLPVFMCVRGTRRSWGSSRLPRLDRITSVLDLVTAIDAGARAAVAYQV